MSCKKDKIDEIEYVTPFYSGINFEYKTKNKISWKDNFSENVKIELYLNNSFKGTIENSIENSGSYNWSVHDSLPRSEHYKFKISKVDNPLVYCFSKYDFSIGIGNGNNNIIYYIRVTNPNGNETWIRGTSAAISWQTNIPDKVYVSLYKGDVAVGYVNAPSNNSSVFLGSEFESGSDYRICVSGKGVFDFSDDYFKIQ